MSEIETMPNLIYEMSLIPSKQDERDRIKELGAKCLSILQANDLMTVELTSQRDELLDALKEIAKTEGPYSIDPLTFANNTIKNMLEIAVDAIKKAEKQ